MEIICFHAGVWETDSYGVSRCHYGVSLRNAAAHKSLVQNENSEKYNSANKYYGVTLRNTFTQIVGWKRKDGPKHP